MIYNFKLIKSINLKSNDIDEEGIKEISNVLDVNNTLLWMDLRLTINALKKSKKWYFLEIILVLMRRWEAR